MTSADQPAPSDAENADFGEGAADAFSEGTPEGGAPEADPGAPTPIGTAQPPTDERARL